MKGEILHCRDINSLPDIAAAILKLGANRPLFAFYGEMGAGKTTLIKTVCAELGVKEEVSSPTYSIVNEYISPRGKVFHFDLYRIKQEEELFDIGFEEYLASGNLCLIEWPERGEEFYTPDKVNRIRIRKNDEDGSRIIEFQR